MFLTLTWSSSLLFRRVLIPFGGHLAKSALLSVFVFLSYPCRGIFNGIPPPTLKMVKTCPVDCKFILGYFLARIQ